VILNADEARALAGEGADDEALAAALAPGLGSLVIVTGERGASAAGAGLRTSVSATDTSGAVDTTGAGDAFAASVIAALGEAWPSHLDGMRAAISGALSLAGEVVRVAGAQGSVAGERAAEPS